MAPPQGDVGHSNQYGSLTGKYFDEEELRPLTTTTEIAEAKNSCFRKLKSMLVIAGAVVVLFLGVTIWSHHRRGSFSSNRDTNSDFVHPPVLESPTSLGLTSLYRQDSALPSELWGKHATEGPLPTNSWYLNLVSHRAATHPDESSTVYTVPYKIDTAPPKEKVAAGVRVHWPVLQASTNNIQMVDDFKNMLALGSSTMDPKYLVNPDQPLSPLGVSLQWKCNKDPTQTMVSHVVRGMPYVTMEYHGGALPSLYSYNGPASEIETDGTKGNLVCGVTEDGESVIVQNEMKLHLANSDFTWIVFFSRSVRLTCQISSKDVQTNDLQVDVTSYDGQDGDESLVVRLALLDQCTSGSSNIAQHCAAKGFSDPKAYETLLREHASAIPTSPQIEFAYASSKKTASKKGVSEIMTIDWGVQKYSNISNNGDDVELLSYALPHHQASLGNSSANITDQCISTFHGNTCLVKGNRWTLSEDLGPAMSFTAPRPPEPAAIPTLAQTLSEDLKYQLSSNMKRGAADTYFSGKLLARLGRVVVIANELLDLAAGRAEYDDVDVGSLALATKAAVAADLPSKESIKDAIEQLKQGVEIWLTKPEATYLYDQSWGGFVNCGCRYTGKGGNGYCNNTFPGCPALADVNEDFGNAWYADHHYHYGYHVYAAAVVAKFDPAWGEKFFDEIMLYIRDFANPFEDKYFTPFRQKDWFLGSSWASGIVSAETSPHGRDEESSSEAIAAYEAVTLFGTVMADHFAKTKNAKLKTAEIVRDAGQLLVATELSATNRYWHVWNSATHNSTYPSAYTLPVVGMMHETMASFGTWFSPQPVVSYGIQLMPLTPVAEQRDVPEWAALLYPLYKESCDQAGDFCVDNGWSIMQAGLLATAGDHEGAMEQAMSVPSKVFDSQGGLGNSRSNLIWYISTRKAYSPEI